MPLAGRAIRPLIVRPKDTGGCWDWAGAKTDGGHGKKTVNGQQVLAHRWIWETFFGAVPVGLVVYASCGTRGCCNPFHLLCGTQAENVRQGDTAILLPEDVKEIRAAKADKGPNTARVLAEKFGCSVGLVRDIWRGAAWARGRKFHGPSQPRNQHSPRAASNKAA